jgi:hypothetical protein
MNWEIVCCLALLIGTRGCSSTGGTDVRAYQETGVTQPSRTREQRSMSSLTRNPNKAERTRTADVCGRGYAGMKADALMATDLLAFLTALDATPRALRRDACGERAIVGKSGHVYADAGFLLYVSTAESPRRWTNVKHRLNFCRVTQDGDDEGCLHLDRLPTPEEAGLIREALGIRKLSCFSAESLAALKARLPTAEKRPLVAEDSSKARTALELGSYALLA